MKNHLTPYIFVANHYRLSFPILSIFLVLPNDLARVDLKKRKAKKGGNKWVSVSIFSTFSSFNASNEDLIDSLTTEQSFDDLMYPNMLCSLLIEI